MLGRLISLFLAVLFVLSAPLALLAFDTGRVVYDPPLVKRLVSDEVLGSDLIPLALEWFSKRRAEQRVQAGEALTGQTEPDIVLLMSYLDRDDWRRVKAEVLPAEILVRWVSASVDGVYAWIDSAHRVPQISLDLKPFKDRVGSQHGVNAIMIAFGKLAPCSQSEIEDFQRRQAAAGGAEVLYNLCQFPDPWREDQVGDYVRSVANVAAVVPDTFALTEELTLAGGTTPRGVGPAVIKTQLRLTRTLMNLAWVLPLLLLLLILAVRIRTLSGFGRWWGVPLLVAGLICLLAATTYRWPIAWFLATGPLSEAPPLIVQEAIRVCLRLAEHIFAPLLVQSLAMAASGLLLVVLWLVTRRRAVPRSQLTHQAGQG